MKEFSYHLNVNYFIIVFMIFDYVIPANGPLDPYASDDEDQLKAMAAKFEAKYATAKDKVKKKKKERKLDDYADLG